MFLSPNCIIIMLSKIAQLIPTLLFIYSIVKYIETNDIMYIYLLIGQVINEYINVHIKRRLSKTSIQYFLRPKTEYDCDFPHEKKTNPIGMPSGHSQQVSFFVSALYFYEGKKWTFGKKIAMLALMCVQGYHRYTTGCHTVPQIGVGLGTGILFARIYTIMMPIPEES